jgi:hypothetical protein
MSRPAAHRYLEIDEAALCKRTTSEWDSIPDEITILRPHARNNEKSVTTRDLSRDFRKTCPDGVTGVSKGF